MTESRYPMVALGEVLQPGTMAVPIESDTTYPTAGLFSFGRGLFAKPPLRGADTKYRQLVELRRDQFVVARLNAWEGALAVVPPEFDRTWVSPEFPVFEIRPGVLDANYLGWLCRWPSFWTEFGVRTQGSMVRRKRVQAADVLKIRVPLPPLNEQRRVMSRLSAAGSTVAASRSRAVHLRQDVDTLASVLAHRRDLDREQKVQLGWREHALIDLLHPARDIHAVCMDASYPNFGILSFARGLFAKPPIEGASTSAKELYRVRKGQFIYSRLFAFEGAFARVTEPFDGFFVSGEFPAFDCDDTKVTPEFLVAYFRVPSVWADLAAKSKGLGLRRQRVQVDELLSHRLLVPPRPEQDRIRAVLEKAERAEMLLDQQTKTLDALVPAVLNRAFAGEL